MIQQPIKAFMFEHFTIGTAGKIEIQLNRNIGREHFIYLMCLHHYCNFWVVSSWLNAQIVGRLGDKHKIDKCKVM
jgi:hypothetical protein